MHKLSYQITSLSPLLLATGGGASHFSTTRQYIRGTILLGMFAGQYIRMEKLKDNIHEDPIFKEWFLHGPLSFGNAYINGSIPLPLSIRGDKEDDETAYDGLLNEPPGRTKGIGGFGRIEGNRLLEHRVKRSMNYHHQHDFKTGGAASGIFFNYEAIETGQCFCGDILGPPETLIAFKKRFESQEIFYIGRSRNTQYGKIKLEFTEHELGRRRASPLRVRTNLNMKVAVRRRGEARLRPPERVFSHKDTVTMTLHSALILYNQYGFSTADCRVLEGLFNPEGSQEKRRVRVKKAFVKTGEIENFVSVWRLKRPAEVCFLPGSCFEISGLEPGDEPLLSRMSANGIGERTKEGFGRVIFNLNNSPDLTVKKTAAVTDAQELQSVPKETREILEKIIKKTFFQVIKQDAIKASKSFKGLRSKSILSRLTAMLTVPGQSIGDFKKEVGEELRKTARDNLEACNNGRITMLEFITKEKISQSYLLSENKDDMAQIEELLTDRLLPRDFKEKLLTDAGFEQQLKVLYFETFFTAMRKRMKAGEENSDE